MSQVNDPTMDVIRAFDNPSAWGDIKDNVPIFRAHKWWVRKLANGTLDEKTTLPGQPDLRSEDGWILKYEVKEEDLDEVCKEVNRSLSQDAKPIKLLVGHRRAGAPQELQPEIAGFGRGAVLGTFGQQNIPAVMTRAYYKKGYENAAADYPERSPEYRHGMKDITAVALLKTEPRLPMGLTGYASVDEVSLYGAGFMADEVTKPEGEKEPPPFEKKPEGEKPAEKPPETPVAPAAPAPEPPAVAPHAVAPLGPEEQNMAMRFYNFYQTTMPEMKYMSGEFAKYQFRISSLGTDPISADIPVSVREGIIQS